jgi:hypothetical protein
MNDQERCIKLAEAMNLDFVAHADMIYLRQGNNPMISWNPLTNANDANALIVFLTQQGYEVHVSWPAGDRLDLRGRVELYKRRRVACEFFDAELFGDAVARAALKVIDNEIS